MGIGWFGPVFFGYREDPAGMTHGVDARESPALKPGG